MSASATQGGHNNQNNTDSINLAYHLQKESPFNIVQGPV